MVTADGEESGELSKLQQTHELLGELSRDERVTVYVARDRSSGKEVAIKVLRAADPQGRESLAHYASDARMLTALEHPNIIAVYAVKWLSEDVVAVITERVRGPSLRQVLDVAGTLPVARATEVIRGLGRALAWAHSSQIMHRDMRPENVIFEDRTGRVVLSDFGLARRIETVPALGEPDPYRAPELVDGRYPDRRSDVYSLGIIGWELLTGRRPWPDDMEPVPPGERAPEPPPLAEVRPGLPPALVAAIEGAVQLERERRLPDVVTFMERLTGVAPPEPEIEEEDEQARDDDSSFAPTEWVALPVPRIPQRPRPAASDRAVSRPVAAEQVTAGETPARAPRPGVQAESLAPQAESDTPLAAPSSRADKQPRPSKSDTGTAARATSPAAKQQSPGEPAPEVARPETREPESEVSDRPSYGAAAGSVAGAAAAAAEPSIPIPSPAPRRPADAPRAKSARSEVRTPRPQQGEPRAEGIPVADRPDVDLSRADLHQADLADEPLPHADVPFADLPVADSPRARGSRPESPRAAHPAGGAAGLESPLVERPTPERPRADRPRGDRSRTERPLTERPPFERPPAESSGTERSQRRGDVPLADVPFRRPEAPAARADRSPASQAEVERDGTARWAAPLSDVELPPPEPVRFADMQADMQPEPISGPISGPVRDLGRPPERFEPAMRGGLGTPRPPMPREPKSRDRKRNSLGTPAPALQPVWDTPVEFPLPAMPDPRPAQATGVGGPPSGRRYRLTRRGAAIAAIVVAALIGAFTLARMERAPDTTADLMRPETPAGYGGDVVLEPPATDSNAVRGPASATPGGGGARRGSGATPTNPSNPAVSAPSAPRPNGAAAPSSARTGTAAPSRGAPSGAAPAPVSSAGTSTSRPAATRPTPTATTSTGTTATRTTPPRDARAAEGAVATSRDSERPAAAVAADAPNVAEARPSGRCGSAALADQRACLAAHIARSDAGLNETYGDVIVAMRQRASSAPGDPDPPEVQRLRAVQRSWLVQRDVECRRRGRGREGRLWATPRAQCLEAFTAERNRELSAMLSRLRRN